MATVQKLTFSNSTNGRPILIGNSSSPGTLIHVGSTVSTTYDEIWLYCTNNSSQDILLSIQFGDIVTPNDMIQLTVSYKEGLFLVLPGLIFKGNSTPLNLRAFADTQNVVSVLGWVNRIQQ